MLSEASSVSQAKVSPKYGNKCAEMVEMVIMVDVVVMVELESVHEGVCSVLV